MSTLAELVDGVIGVDSHRDTLAAAALNPVGGLLGQTAARANTAGATGNCSASPAAMCQADAAGPSRAPAATALGWPPSSAPTVSGWSRPRGPSDHPGAAGPRPTPSTPSGLPVTPLASSPTSWQHPPARRSEEHTSEL